MDEKCNLRYPKLKIRMYRNVSCFNTSPKIPHNFQGIHHYIVNLWKGYVYSIIRYWHHTKGRVRVRKSKSGEKWNEKSVNDAYGVLLHRCCTSKLWSWKSQILHHGCTPKREICTWASWAFLQKLMHFKDFKWIFPYQRTPALIILFQHINKYGN